MRGIRFDENGDVVESKVTIVWGSPASGKTTYVRRHMREGDMVVDLDLIKQAISLQAKTETSDILLPTALSIQEHLYSLIQHRRFAANAVWVVAGLPRREQRQELQRRLKADEMVFVAASKQECVDRAMRDDERTDKELQRKIIDRWFEAYQED